MFTRIVMTITIEHSGTDDDDDDDDEVDDDAVITKRFSRYLPANIIKTLLCLIESILEEA